MQLPADVTFRRDELSDVLKLSPAVVDALFDAGAIRSQDGAIAATELERLFRDSLLRVYQAQAMRVAARANDELEIEIESKPDPDSPIITHTFDDNIAMGERTCARLPV